VVDSVLSTTLRFLDNTPTGRIVARCAPLADDLEAVCENTAAVFLNSLLRVLYAGLPGPILRLVSRHTILLPSASQLNLEVSRPFTLIVGKGGIAYLGTSVGGLASI